MAGAGVDCPHCSTPLNLVEPGSLDPVPAGPSEGSEAVGCGLSAADLATALSGSLPPRRVTWTYRAALFGVAAAMVLLPMAYVALVAGCGWILWRLAEAWWRSAAEAAPGVATVFWIGVQATGLLLGVVVFGFLVRPAVVRRTRRSAGLVVRAAEEPLLFAFIHMIADTVGAPRPTQVQVDCRLNASAGYRGSWGGMGVVGGDFILTLGLPLVAVLDLRQLAGVIAHELAHFGQGAGLRASTIIRRVNAWLEGRGEGPDAWRRAMGEYAAAAPLGPGRILVGGARLGLAVSRVLFRGLGLLGRGVGGVLLRQMERDADACQIAVSGSEAFEQTLRRRTVLAAVARELYRDLRVGWERNRVLPDDLPEAIRREEASLSEGQRERLSGRAFGREATLWDTHPPDAERLDQARDAAAPGLFRLMHPATSVFAGFGRLCREATVQHWEGLLGMAPGMVRWVPPGEPGVPPAEAADS